MIILVSQKFKDHCSKIEWGASLGTYIPFINVLYGLYHHEFSNMAEHWELMYVRSL